MFLMMASQHNGIEDLLKTFFSFLHRKTDFYVVSTQQNGRMGFPAGVAEKLLIRAFRALPMKDIDAVSKSMDAGRRREEAALAAKAKRAEEKRARAKAKAQALAKAQAQAQAQAEIGAAKRASKTKSDGAGASASSASAPETSSAAQATVCEPGSDGAFDASDAAEPSAEPSADPSAAEGKCKGGARATMKQHAPADAEDLDTECADEGNSGTPAVQLHPDGDLRVRYTADGKQIPIGNGGVTPSYWWTQTLYDTTVYIAVPEGTRARDLDVSIRACALRVALRSSSGGGGSEHMSTIVDGALPERVRVDESYWNLESNRTIVIMLQKIVQTWWRSVVEGDQEIDCTKVDSTQKIDEYDEETQGAIRKIMFDQKQKAMGLPTSDEMQANDILEQAKGLPGSPFLPPSAGGAPLPPPPT